jgi:hypothetical protein
MPSLRKQLAPFDAFARRPCDAWAKPYYRSHVRQGERSLSLLRKFFQTLRPNYSDEMAQFVFDIAGHSDGVCDFLAQ